MCCKALVILSMSRQSGLYRQAVSLPQRRSTRISNQQCNEDSNNENINEEIVNDDNHEESGNDVIPENQNGDLLDDSRISTFE